MKKNKISVLPMIFFILFSHLSIYAETTTLDEILDQLTKPQITTFQKLNLIEHYKGQKIKGDGKVKDVLKNYGDENEAVVYIQKPFRGKQYDISLIVSRDSAEKIKKGKTVGFEGTFVRMTFETLRFEDAEITGISKGWWPF